MKRFFVCSLMCLILSGAASSLAAGWDDPNSLPIDLTEEEKQRLDEIGIRHRVTKQPTGEVRNPGEWEPSEGVIIRWPLGIPVDLIAEMSEDIVVTTIVETTAEQSSAISTYTSGGVNMANLDWIFAPTDSYWTRDYGPWFIFDDLDLAIVDHVYNRPRPNDDVIPQEIGTAWGMAVHGMDLIHTGGNHMSEGLGMSMSTELVYDENPSKTQTEIHDLMRDYLGNEYTVLEYIEDSGIHHIDCWAKFLRPDTILVKDVDPSNSSYDRLNARADFLATQTSAWGVPYDVVRVYCPSGTAYTNSIILNDKVLVPQFGSSGDATALQVYQDTMPGYEILGFDGSWLDDDAIHCRTMGVPDRGMLHIDHTPFRSEDVGAGDYLIEAEIVAHSGYALIADSLKVHYQVDGGPWYEVVMTFTGVPDMYSGDIPAQLEGSVIRYYLEAGDASGRVETHPYIGEPWAHTFTVPGTSLTYQSHVFTDVCNGSGSSTDGIVDAGEELAVFITLLNDGAYDTTGVSAVLSSATAGVTVTVDSAAYPVIVSGGSGQSLTAYMVQVDETVACGTDLVFALAITSNEGSWNEDPAFTLTAGTLLPGGGTIFSDDFETADLAGWSVTTGPGSHTCGDWMAANTGTQRPSGGSGYYALADSDDCGSGSTTSTDLTSDPIDCSDPAYLTVTLECDLYYRYYNGDDATVQVYDGSTWQILWTAGASTENEHKSWDVSAHALNNANFQILFSYQNASWDYWLAVDNVELTYTAPAGCDMDVCVGAGLPPGETGPGTGGSSTALIWTGGTTDQLEWPDNPDATDFYLYRGDHSDLADLSTGDPDFCQRWTGTDLFTGGILTEDPATACPAADCCFYLILGSNAAGMGDPGHGRTLDPSGACP